MRYRPSLRAIVAASLLLGTVVFLHARRRGEIIPHTEKLALFPTEVEGWTGHELVIPPSFLEVLGPGEFLSRLYTKPQQVPIDFFVAYFPSQSTGDTIHSPKNCLPGAGWSPIQSKYIQLTGSDGKPFLANSYVIAKGADRELVVYWYQAHSRRVASEYWAKFWLVADAIRLNRTDGSLVRIITPIAPNESLPAAEIRATSFATLIMPALSRHIPD